MKDLYTKEELQEIFSRLTLEYTATNTSAIYAISQIEDELGLN